MSREWAPVCDYCFTRANWSEWTSGEAVTQARKDGWLMGKKHKCPDCRGVED